MMNRKVCGFAFAALLFALRFFAGAQQANKVPPIANYLRIDSATGTPLGTFRPALSELAFTDEKNLAGLATEYITPMSRDIGGPNSEE